MITFDGADERKAMVRPDAVAGWPIDFSPGRDQLSVIAAGQIQALRLASQVPARVDVRPLLNARKLSIRQGGTHSLVHVRSQA